MNFSKALEAVKNGHRISRAGWNGKGLHVELQKPDQHSKMTLPYLFLVYPGSEQSFPNKVPWLASQTDLLAEDWNVLVSVEKSGPKKLYAYRNSRGNLQYLETEFNGNQQLKRAKGHDKVIQ